jgi:hypothetical protein
MAIKNAYAKKHAGYYIEKIQNVLVEHGAVGMQMLYDADKRISQLQFAIPFKDGKNVRFQLPCEWRKFQQVLLNQGMPRANDEDYAYRAFPDKPRNFWR